MSTLSKVQSFEQVHQTEELNEVSLVFSPISLLIIYSCWTLFGSIYSYWTSSFECQYWVWSINIVGTFQKLQSSTSLFIAEISYKLYRWVLSVKCQHRRNMNCFIWLRAFHCILLEQWWDHQRCAEQIDLISFSCYEHCPKFWTIHQLRGCRN